MDIQYELDRLKARLPELEWQLGKLGRYFPFHALPKGLFRETHEADFIQELKEDLVSLASQSTHHARFYLAHQIHKKITILVALCSPLHPQNDKKILGSEGLMNVISTRQQWIEALQNQLQTLAKQKEALLCLAKEKERVEDPLLRLNLQRELGDLEKQLSEIEETYLKATGGA